MMTSNRLTAAEWEAVELIENVIYGMAGARAGTADWISREQLSSFKRAMRKIDRYMAPNPIGD